ncbi:MAG TPA: cyclase family protein [Terriglobia bacterium]|nr:cyclase family protein [Terriglobia bacterium]
MQITRRLWLARTGLLSMAAALGIDFPARGREQPHSTNGQEGTSLWQVYEQSLKGAKYVDLTHKVNPHIPVWHGFGPSRFLPTVDPETGRAYTYEQDGFEATHYDLSTDQLGTQLDPPAHWNPYFPSIDELPPTFAVRPLVVIPIQQKVARDPGYQMGIGDIHDWEKRHGRIPQGSVVFVRSDWSKEWPNPDLATRKVFPGVQLAALKFLHLERHILFHGHEPLDTDTTPTFESERWLLTNGYTQGEGVTNLDKVPEKGALVTIGFPRLQGGTGGYARYIAICPPDWKFGISIGEFPESPLPRSSKPLRWDQKAGMRIR